MLALKHNLFLNVGNEYVLNYAKDEKHLSVIRIKIFRLYRFTLTDVVI